MALSVYEGDDERHPGEEAFIVCDNLVKIYQVADIEVMALQGLDLRVEKGEVMAIIGASGSGKSTLLNVLGGLDTPSAGQAWVDGKNLNRLTPKDQMIYRRKTVGFVWQNVGRNLIPYLTARENVLMPMIVNGTYNPSRADELLEIVGLGHRLTHKPMHMSGGEQQRVAIAIGLANDPPLLLADEPTGSVDTDTADVILQVFNDVRERYGVTVVIVTHDRSMARAVDRFVEIRDGKTSAMAVRRAARPARRELDDQGVAMERDDTHEAFTLLDSAGRLQIPPEFRERWQITDRVQLHVDESEGRIVITPPR